MKEMQLKSIIKWSSWVVGALVVLTIGSCYGVRSKTIGLGYTGIKINKLGSQRGVSKEDVVTGFLFYNPIMSSVVVYPTFNQRVAWTSDKTEGNQADESLSFQTKDTVKVNMNVAVNYTLQAAMVPEFYTKFRCDDINQFTMGFMRDQARAAVSSIGSEYTFDEVNGTKKEEFLARIATRLSDAVKPYGVIVDKNGFSLIGALEPPDGLKSAINAKVQAIQNAIKTENEMRQTIAEAKKVTAQAEGEAAANRAKASSLTPGLMEWKRLEIDEIRAKKWDGKLPTTQLGGGTNVLYGIK